MASSSAPSAVNTRVPGTPVDHLFNKARRIFSPDPGRNDDDMTGAMVPVPQPNFDSAHTLSATAPASKVGSSFSMEALTLALSPLQNSIDAIKSKLDNVAAHLGKLERRIDLQDIRVEKLEETINHPDGFRTDPSIAQKLDELQKMVDDMKCQPPSIPPPLDPNPLSAVIGGLKDLSFEDACKWLDLKLQALQGPRPATITKRTDTFTGVLFAKFG